MPRPLSSPRLTLAVLAAASGVFAMLQSLVSPVLPTIQTDLGTSRSTVTWVLTAWLMSASVATPLLGRLGDSLGKRRTLLVALGAVSAGSLLAALAPNIGVLVAARVVQGLGGAVFPLAFGIVRDEFPAERVAPAIGSLSAVLAGGGGLGLVLSGPIEAHLGWRWLFWIPMVAVAVTAVLVRFLVPESPVRHRGRIDWRAALLLSGWLVALLTPVSRATDWGWGSWKVLGLFALATVLFCCWIAVESRSADPLVDLRMMRLPAVWTTNAVAVLFGASMFAVTAFVPQFLQTPTTAGYGFGLSVTEAGLLNLPMLAAMAVGGVLSGALAARVSPKAQLVVSALLSTAACAAFAFLSDHPWEVATAGGVFGLGLGLAYAAMSTLIVRSVPAHRTGVATGMNANIRNIGGAIGTAVVATLVTSDPLPGGLPREAGFTHAFLLLTVTSAITVALAALVPAGQRRGTGVTGHAPSHRKSTQRL
ncbi:MFS transporter [Streptomyces pseudogriseolus]|uniref:MFS transporter n=1 Tax=Streptomyces pseudogriseolus TaxID=36817 RepID=UPI003FA2D140